MDKAQFNLTVDNVVKEEVTKALPKLISAVAGAIKEIFSSEEVEVLDKATKKKKK